MNIIKNLPIPVSGLILALLSLGNLTSDINPYLKYIFGCIGIIFLILLILKSVLYPESIKNDFKNPVILSSSGTFSMSVILLSTYVMPFIPTLAYGLWIVGIGLHILLVIYFTYHFIIRNFDITTVYPSYWIVYIGITMAAVTSPALNISEIGFYFFIAGFIGMISTFPLIVYRYLNYRDIPDSNKPLVCIFNAVTTILIVGYLNSAQNISYEFVMLFYSFACVFYIFALYKFITFRNLDFYPSFSAFTFPFVISTTATKGVMTLFNNSILGNVYLIELAIAVALVIYVLIRYVIFLKKSSNPY